MLIFTTGGNLLNPFNPKSRLYKKNWLYFLAVGIIIILSGLAVLIFLPLSNNLDLAIDYFLIGLGYGLLICADVSRRFEKKLP